ncbi:MULTISPECIES: WS/DGAT/MGAT family O-acyltransferase [unclassified Nocardioides]|jgi:diacylglycerol O-acyltransferase / wax synthase|uniref:WS/DGAT/MGAT family O-acyltransferase n=1 Tax=Nocardioides sp. URHA0032 TaxID=1380388 RepID=UPI000491283B|nr:wax ester/triacylglycerol synthase family O-acyltransferase [Nocardioides sp. URHA0032]
MSERLRPRDVALLAEESASTPMHNATVEIFDPGQSGFDYAELVRLVQERISFVPRYRQRVQTVPGRIANPVWVDDDHFDLGYHVRRSALPRPGTLDQLRELVARIVSRPLDRHRPLWEIYFVEGLADGRVALLSKAHQVLVDGMHTVDLGQVLLDTAPEPKELGGDEWRPHAGPSPFSLMAGAIKDSVTERGTVTATARSTTGALVRGVAGVARSAGRVTDALTNRTPSPDSPIIGPLSQQRRVVAVRTDLADYRKVREAHGGTVNDVVLATVTGALRSWLMTRGESMRGVRQIRAVVPISVIDDEMEATSLGSQIAPHFVDLPVWEPSPVVRLHQVSYSFLAHKETGRAVAASRLTSISGFAPATFHAIGSRLAATERRSYQLSVTNVPGPQAPLYAAGARMLETYPVPPLLEGHPLAIGVTSYDGHVYYGITADRDLLPDADLLGPCIREALDELVDSASGGRTRAPRGRRKRKTETQQ